MLAVALFALAWAIARACLQSITLDEAASYQLFAAPDWARCWYPSSGNHVLNTILERASVRLFGLSEVAVRAPALLGAAVYIAACYRLCSRIGIERSIRWPLFLCLVYNPFVMDYLVAARGYSLALGFLMAAVWAMSEKRFAAASVFVGLSFCANFSFAWIDAAAILLFAAGAFLQTRNWRTLSLCLVPGAVTALLICGRTVWAWPPGQLYYGATQPIQMWNSIVSSTFDELNPRLVHDLEAVRLGLAWLVALVLVWQILRIVWAAHPLGLLLSRAAALALLCHWLAFRLFQIPLPMERTAIFFVPLALLLIGIGAALPGAALPRFAGVAVLSLSALYFLGCLRLSHFREWKFDAEVKQAFAVLEDLNRRSPIRTIEANWRYADPLNFYRELRHAQSIPECTWAEPHSEGMSAYVLYSPVENDFIEEQALQVVYRATAGGLVVAVPRQYALTPASRRSPAHP